MRSRKPITERVADDLGGAFTVGLAYIGDRLGLFAALARLGRSSSVGLAERTGLQERYVREWLNAMVASEYIEYDPDEQSYFLTPEQEAALVDEAARTFVGGAFGFALPSLLLAPRIIEAFKQGGGISFGELPAEIPAAIDRMHRPWFDHLLTQQWLPGVPGLLERLSRGIAVLDVGCGLGRSTIAMATGFPKSTILGIDPHAPSIERARSLAVARGLSNARFAAHPVETLSKKRDATGATGATGAEVRGDEFDLVVAIDSIHDMANPIESLRAMRDLLSANGLVFWSEPTGSRDPLQNRNPQGRLRASLSPFHCLTVSLAAGGAGLGTIIGEAGVRELAQEAGFSSIQRLEIESPVQQFFALRA
jgi:2-polyprenyl-3-methyl-5-hydroxy-6-metoxy-1,4-benzoquinol methylase